MPPSPPDTRPARDVQTPRLIRDQHIFAREVSVGQTKHHDCHDDGDKQESEGLSITQPDAPLLGRRLTPLGLLSVACLGRRFSVGGRRRRASGRARAFGHANAGEEAAKAWGRVVVCEEKVKNWVRVCLLGGAAPLSDRGCSLSLRRLPSPPAPLPTPWERGPGGEGDAGERAVMSEPSTGLGYPTKTVESARLRPGRRLLYVGFG